jgi:glucosyl-3-phosphoglycerate synthase
MSAMIRTFDHHDFDAWSLVAAKGDQRISVCLPAHNEEATVATIVERFIEHLVVRVPLVDEVVVVDDHSADATAKVAVVGAVAFDHTAKAPARAPCAARAGHGCWRYSLPRRAPTPTLGNHASSRRS